MNFITWSHTAFTNTFDATAKHNSLQLYWNQPISCMLFLFNGKTYFSFKMKFLFHLVWPFPGKTMSKIVLVHLTYQLHQKMYLKHIFLSHYFSNFDIIGSIKFIAYDAAMLAWKRDMTAMDELRRLLDCYNQDGKRRLLISRLGVFLTRQKCPCLHANS